MARAVLAILALTGCDDAEDEGLRVATYNTGLAQGYVPLATERAPRTIDAVAALAADLVCLQEVWRPADVDTLRAATGDRWPHTMVPAPQPGTAPGTAPACESRDLEPLVGCVASSCGGVSSDLVAGCALSVCGTELFALPSSCSGCLAASVGGSFEDAQRTCTTTPGPTYAFGGSFGLAMLSRLPLLDQDTLVLDSTLNRRAVLYARVEAEEVEAHVFCTHLTAVLDDIPYPGALGWEAEQRAQIEALLDFVDAKTDAESRVVLLGDLNTGPGVSGLMAVTPDNYALLFTRFTDNALLEASEGPLCTFCPDNPLVPDATPPMLIDHVLARNLDLGESGARILTENVEVDVGGTLTVTALSDHYGVRAALIE